MAAHSREPSPTPGTDPPDEGPGGSSNGRADHPADAFKAIGEQVAELKDYAAYLIAAKVDGVKLTVRNVALYAVLGLLGGIVGAAILVTAGVMLLRGLAGAIGAVFGNEWLGEIIVSMLVLIATGAGAWLLLRRMMGTSRRKTREKYERARHHQRAKRGHDVRDRAAGDA